MIKLNDFELRMSTKVSDESVDAFIDGQGNHCLKIRKDIGVDLYKDAAWEIINIYATNGAPEVLDAKNTIFAVRLTDGALMAYQYNCLVHSVECSIKILA